MGADWFGMQKLAIVCLVVVCLGTRCEASPKYEDSQKTYPNNQWRRTTYKENDTSVGETNVNDRTERLGFSTGYGGSQGTYPYSSGSGVGGYSPLRLDLGGLVMGAIIGIGALLIVPKLVGVFHSGYGGSGNYRSAIENESNGLAEMLSKLDEILGANNIDSTACVQRAVCSYVRSSETNMASGNADQSEQIIHSISGNALVDYMLNGTAIKEALENGRNVQARDCDALYPGCPMDRNSINGVLNKILPNNKGT